MQTCQKREKGVSRNVREVSYDDTPSASYLVHSLANYALTLPIETGLSTAVLVEIRVKIQFNLETAPS